MKRYITTHNMLEKQKLAMTHVPNGQCDHKHVGGAPLSCWDHELNPLETPSHPHINHSCTKGMSHRCKTSSHNQKPGIKSQKDQYKKKRQNSKEFWTCHSPQMNSKHTWHKESKMDVIPSFVQAQKGMVLMELLLWKDHIKTRRHFWPCGPQQFQPQVWFSITLVNYIITVSHAPLRTLYMSDNSIWESWLLFSGIYSKYISHSSISKGAAKNLIPSQRWRLGLSLV